jgi:solute:Na+ symporter, SSS family
VGMGQSHIFVLSGDDGSRVAEVEVLRDEHPGFRREVLAYHTITDTWIVGGESAANQVTTAAAPWAGGYVVATGEVRPRHRTSAVWWVTTAATTSGFGAIDFVVLVIYLLAMVGVGVGLARRNANTEDYFRGSQRTRWWVAGCSIFATMLSSITYMAIPAKAFAQDLVYLVGNFMILAVAPIAIYLALPFFRRLDVTSAYEYLERRFNRSVRWFASVSFTLFHVFRMGIVMSLAALALATITPLSATQCVLLMGGLSVLYCTLGGIAAVMWTDTIQTVVLLGGGLLCFALAVAGATGGWGEAWRAALEDGKLRAYNPGWDPTSPALVLWVVALGAIGQNVSSYTADQAVVQRYLTTPDPRRAAHSIWAAALLAMPASILFYFLGTALYLYYKSHPEQLDPTFMTDQILPQFIAHAVPSGVAGLIVAGIFAAAQSTISTSMNSTATAVVTDFLRPLGVARDERGYLRWARALTLASGLGGTALGVTFIDPANRSLFDSFLRVVGLFMGVLGGLFLLGMLTRRATGWGAMIGAMAGASVMALLPICTAIHGYLYAAIGIAVCFVVGYAASRLWPAPADIRGLTIHTRVTGLRSKP